MTREEAQAGRDKISNAQSETRRNIDRCVGRSAARDPDSLAILLTWSGRCYVSQSWFSFYGQIPQTIPIPQPFMSQLGDLVRRCMRFFHPRHKTLPGDETAVRLVETAGVDPDKGNSDISESNASSFFSFVEKKGYFGRMQVQGMLQEAWSEWNAQNQQQQQQKKKRTDA